MAKLTRARRKWLAKHRPSVFVFPPTRDRPLGGYPIDTAARGRDALSRVSRFGSPEEQRAVCRAVGERWPEIHSSYCRLHRGR